jgi:RNA 3'-terminal phosphate cyclase (ATP)
VIHIDGSFGEGGGQVFRSALTLATVTRQPVHIERIRAKRPNPGLAPQHRTVLRALAGICSAEVFGDEIGSQEVTFHPAGEPQSGRYTFDVAQLAQGGSAGSVTLIFQALVLPLAVASGRSHLTLRGGTHVAWSPPYDALEGVYLPMLASMGLEASCSLDAWGFYPRGGGQMSAVVHGLERSGGMARKELEEGMQNPFADIDLASLELISRGELVSIRGRSVACNLPSHIAQRMGDRARGILERKGMRTDIRPMRVSGRGPGAGIFLIAEYEHTLAGFSALGRPGKPSEQVAEEVSERVLNFHTGGAVVDQHLADQLLLPLAFAGGRSSMVVARITRHLQTNAYVIQQFLPVQVEIEGQEDRPGRVYVHSAG